MSDNAAVTVAKQRSGDRDDVVVLSTGVQARIKPVAASLIDEVTARIEDPPVPIWRNPDKERDEENPADPAYQRTLAEADRKRGIAAIDAVVMFGVELEDGLPEDGGWLKKLKYMEKRGHLDLGEYDLEDEMDQEFLFKRYVAVASPDLALVMLKSGVQTEAVAQATRSFQGDDTGPTD